jgi:Ca2+-binding RTX toxin-like protein
MDGRTVKLVRRCVLTVFLSALSAAVGPYPAAASVEIGQLAPGVAINVCNQAAADELNSAVTSGNSYVVPEDGTITSWTHNAGPNPGAQLTMKVFRNVAGLNWMVVGHDGPRAMVPSGTAGNTFGVSIAVKGGDVLGLNSGDSAVTNACRFFAAVGQHYQARLGDLADGASGDFTDIASGYRVNVSAILEPDCDQDGLGDETQDTNLSTCAPGTTPTGSSSVTCKGKLATIVGTNGNDVRVASPGPDVIAGLGGNDTLSGLAGNDLICGGPGKDKLKGGTGKDTLLGQAGKDTLKGGGAKDVCKGGKGSDSGNCEVEKSL